MPGIRCAVSFCNNSRENTKDRPGPQVSFHRFPKDPALRKQWIQWCRRSGDWSPDSCLVCSDHFEDSDFERDLRAELLNLPKRKILKKDALPSRKGIPSPSQLESADKRKQRHLRRTSKKMVEEILANEEEVEVNKERVTDVTVASHCIGDPVDVNRLHEENMQGGMACNMPNQNTYVTDFGLQNPIQSYETMEIASDAVFKRPIDPSNKPGTKELDQSLKKADEAVAAVYQNNVAVPRIEIPSSGDFSYEVLFCEPTMSSSSVTASVVANVQTPKVNADMTGTTLNDEETFAENVLVNNCHAASGDSATDEVFVEPKRPPPKKVKRKASNNKNPKVIDSHKFMKLLQNNIMGRLASTRDEFSIFGEHVACQMRNLKDARLQSIARLLVNNVFYHLENGSITQATLLHGPVDASVLCNTRQIPSDTV